MKRERGGKMRNEHTYPGHISGVKEAAPRLMNSKLMQPARMSSPRAPCLFNTCEARRAAGCAQKARLGVPDGWPRGWSAAEQRILPAPVAPGSPLSFSHGTEHKSGICPLSL